MNIFNAGILPVVILECSIATSTTAVVLMLTSCSTFLVHYSDMTLDGVALGWNWPRAHFGFARAAVRGEKCAGLNSVVVVVGG